MTDSLVLTGDEVIGWTRDRFAELNLPMPAKPQHVGQYTFPEDPDELTGPEVAQLMLRLAGFCAHIFKLLAIVESEGVALEREWRLRIGEYTTEVRAKLGGRPAHDTVEIAVVTQHEELRPLYNRMTQLEVVRTRLRRYVEMYQVGYQAMSREASRRSDQLRAGG